MTTKVPTALKEHMQELVRKTAAETFRACSSDTEKTSKIFTDIYQSGEMASLPQCINTELRGKITYLHTLFVAPDTSRVSSINGQADVLEKFQGKMVKFTKGVLETLDSAKMQETPTASSYKYTIPSVVQNLDVTIESTLVESLVESQRGNVVAEDCSLNQVNAALNVELRGCKAANVTSSRGSITAVNSESAIAAAALNVLLVNFKGTSVQSQRGALGADSSSIQNGVAALNVTYKGCEGNRVESQRGQVEAKDSKLDSVQAALDVNLTKCNVSSVISNRGKVEWNGSLDDNYKVDSARAALDVNLSNLSIETVTSERGRVSLSSCTAAKVESALSATLTESFVTDVDVLRGELSLSRTFATKAQAQSKVTLADSTIEELCLKVQGGEEGVIEVPPGATGTIKSIILEIGSGISVGSNVNMGNISVSGTSGARLFSGGGGFFGTGVTISSSGGSTSITGGRLNHTSTVDLQCDSIKYDADGGIAKEYEWMLSMSSSNKEVLNINGKNFKKDSATGRWLPLADAEREKIVMTQEQMQRHVLSSLGGGGQCSVITIGVLPFEGGEFSIQNNQVRVIKLPPHWEIKESTSSSPKETKVTLRLSPGLRVEGDIRFRGCKGDVIWNNATHSGQVIGNV